MCRPQNFIIYIGVARGVQWVHLHPQGGEKKFFQA